MHFQSTLKSYEPYTWNDTYTSWCILTQDKTTQQNPQVIHQCQHPHLSPIFKRQRKSETRDKKAREICRPHCNVAMDTSGNHKAKNRNGTAAVCRTKNKPYILQFYSVHLSNTNTRNIYYRWPYHAELIKDTFMYKRNIEAAVLSLRAQSELSHCGRRHTFTQWPTSTTWNGKITSRWHSTSEEWEETDRYYTRWVKRHNRGCWWTVSKLSLNHWALPANT